MSESTSTPETNTAKPAGQGVVRRLLTVGAFAATFVAGGLVLSGPSATAMQMAMDHMSGQGGMHGGIHGDMHAQFHAHIAHMLAAADATPEQKQKIHAILKTAMEQIGPLHGKFAATHKDLHAILLAPTIDRGALEQLRAARMADADQASKVLVQALADVAEVLTPEQRAKVAAAMQHHMDHHSGGHPHS